MQAARLYLELRCTRPAPLWCDAPSVKLTVSRDVQSESTHVHIMYDPPDITRRATYENGSPQALAAGIGSDFPPGCKVCRLLPPFTHCTLRRPAAPARTPSAPRAWQAWLAAAQIDTTALLVSSNPTPRAWQARGHPQQPPCRPNSYPPLISFNPRISPRHPIRPVRSAFLPPLCLPRALRAGTVRRCCAGGWCRPPLTAKPTTNCRCLKRMAAERKCGARPRRRTSRCGRGWRLCRPATGWQRPAPT